MTSLFSIRLEIDDCTDQQTEGGTHCYVIKSRSNGGTKDQTYGDVLHLFRLF